MSRPKRQHYVPQFLLKQFSIPKKPNSIWALNKSTGDVHKQSIGDSAIEKHFYDQAALDSQGINLESQLSRLEGSAADIVKRITSDNSLSSLTIEMKELLVEFILVQNFRTRSAREYAKLGAKIHGVELSEDDAKQATLVTLLRDLEKYYTLCRRHILTLRTTTSKERFVLSDAAVSIVRSEKHRPDTLSQSLPSATLILPISPSHCLILFPHNRVSELNDTTDRFRSKELILDEAQPVAEGDVSSINDMSLYTSNRFLFSCSNNFSEAKRKLIKNTAAALGPYVR